MFKDLINNVQNKYRSIVDEKKRFKEILNSSTIFQNLSPLPDSNHEVSDYFVHYIMNDSPDINMQKAKGIAKLIPIDEAYLATIYAKEIVTGKEYYLIPTSKKLYVIHQSGYLTYPYDSYSCEVIKNNLMGKTILFCNILLEINGDEKKIQTFLSILTDPQIRENCIREKEKFLCGIVPIYQDINAIGSGISIDNSSTIVFHTSEFNYKCRYSDIQLYEILIDNQVYYSSKDMYGVITNYQNSCYQISVHIELNDGKSFILPILKPNAFATKYQRQDKTFQDNIRFARKIIDKIISLDPNNQKS